MVNITEVKVTRFQGQTGKSLGVASITLNNVFVITGLRILLGKGGRPFVSMPQRKDQEGKYHDICFPLNKELRKHIESVVLNEFSNTPQQGGYGQGGFGGSYNQGGFQSGQGGYGGGYNQGGFQGGQGFQQQGNFQGGQPQGNFQQGGFAPNNVPTMNGNQFNKI